MQTRDLSSCPACGGRELGSLPIEYEYQGIRWPAVECGSCHLRFLARQPTQEGFVELYGSDYFQSDYHCGCDERSYFANQESFVKLAHDQLEVLERQTRPGRILEVGCAGGFFLEAARARGWQPVGVEISEVAADYAREKLSLDVRTGTLDTVALEPESFEAVFLGDVLEHVPDPMETLRATHRLLRPGGFLLVDGPTPLNSLSWRIRMPAYRLLHRTRLLHLPPYHVLEFTPSTMKRLISRAGFIPVWIHVKKLPPAPHRPDESGWARAARSGIDQVNRLLTRILGRLGDRATALARKSGGDPARAGSSSIAPGLA